MCTVHPETPAIRLTDLFFLAHTLKYKPNNIVPVFERHTLKAYGRAEVLSHSFLTTVLDGVEWLASRPVRLRSG